MEISLLSRLCLDLISYYLYYVANPGAFGKPRVQFHNVLRPGLGGVIGERPEIPLYLHHPHPGVKEKDIYRVEYKEHCERHKLFPAEHKHQGVIRPPAEHEPRRL